MTLKHKHYRQGTRDAIAIFPSDQTITAQEAIEWLVRDDEKKHMLKKKFLIDNESKIDFLPTNKIIIPVNKDSVLKNGIVAPEDAHRMVSELILEFPVKENQPFFFK